MSGALVGGLVASRKPRNPVGWFFLAGACIGGLQVLAGAYAVYGLIVDPGSVPLASLSAWFSSTFQIVGPIFGFVLLPLYFPNGRPPTPRWRLITWITVGMLPVAILLTAVLVALYFGAIVLSQQVFVFLTGQQSTLVIAALFNPLRGRTQSFVDQRFYRSKYDARKTLESFSARLRDETDLEALNDELLWVVKETMQPAHISLWLRPGAVPEDAHQG